MLITRKRYSKIKGSKNQSRKLPKRKRKHKKKYRRSFRKRNLDLKNKSLKRFARKRARRRRQKGGSLKDWKEKSIFFQTGEPTRNMRDRELIEFYNAKLEEAKKAKEATGTKWSSGNEFDFDKDGGPFSKLVKAKVVEIKKQKAAKEEEEKQPITVGRRPQRRRVVSGKASEHVLAAGERERKIAEIRKAREEAAKKEQEEKEWKQDLAAASRPVLGPRSRPPAPPPLPPPVKKKKKQTLKKKKKKKRSNSDSGGRKVVTNTTRRNRRSRNVASPQTSIFGNIEMSDMSKREGEKVSTGAKVIPRNPTGEKVTAAVVTPPPPPYVNTRAPPPSYQNVARAEKAGQKTTGYPKLPLLQSPKPGDKAVILLGIAANPTNRYSGLAAPNASVAGGITAVLVTLGPKNAEGKFKVTPLHKGAFKNPITGKSLTQTNTSYKPLTQYQAYQPPKYLFAANSPAARSLVDQLESQKLLFALDRTKLPPLLKKKKPPAPAPPTALVSGGTGKKISNMESAQKLLREINKKYKNAQKKIETETATITPGMIKGLAAPITANASTVRKLWKRLTDPQRKIVTNQAKTEHLTKLLEAVLSPTTNLEKILTDYKKKVEGAAGKTAGKTAEKTAHASEQDETKEGGIDGAMNLLRKINTAYALARKNIQQWDAAIPKPTIGKWATNLEDDMTKFHAIWARLPPPSRTDLSKQAGQEPGLMLLLQFILKKPNFNKELSDYQKQQIALKKTPALGAATSDPLGVAPGGIGGAAASKMMEAKGGDGPTGPIVMPAAAASVVGAKVGVGGTGVVPLTPTPKPPPKPTPGAKKVAGGKAATKIGGKDKWITVHINIATEPPYVQIDSNTADSAPAMVKVMTEANN